MLEACLKASSLRLVESTLQSSTTCNQTQMIANAARGGNHFTLRMLDATVSDCLDNAGRRMRENHTDVATGKSTSWVILTDPRELQLRTACSTEHCRTHSRIVYALSKEEIREVLQSANATNGDASYVAIKTIINHLHDTMSSKGVLLVDGVCNRTSYRLHCSQLRLNLYRQSVL